MWNKTHQTGQNNQFPIKLKLLFFLTLNVKSINYTHNLLLYSLIQSSKQKLAHPEYELSQWSEEKPQCPAGVSRLALRSVISAGWGKLHFVLFRRRKWFWSSLLLNSKEEVISNGAEGTGAEFRKSCGNGMKSKYMTSKDLPLWMQPEDARLLQQNAFFTELMQGLHTMNKKKRRKSCLWKILSRPQAWLLFYFSLLTVS